MRRALVIAPMPPPLTGQSLACEVLVDGLRALTVDVVILNTNKSALHSGSASASRVRELGAMLYRLWKDRTAYDMVYFTPAESLFGNLKDLLFYAILWRRLEVTYIHMHGGAGMRNLLSRDHRILRFVNGVFLARLRGAIVLGARLASIYSGLIPQEKIHRVENFASDELFIRRAGLRQKFQSSDKIRVLFLSNLLPGKGYCELVEAIHDLGDEVRERIQVDFAGSFASREDERKFLSEISTLRCVAYHGAVAGEKKRSLLHRAHVFCLPTYYPYEGQPISILEAYASGCAVITTDHSGIRDVFTPGVNGLQVEIRSSGSIRAAICRILDNHTLVRQFGLQNARRARNKFRRKHHLTRMFEVLGLQRMN